MVGQDGITPTSASAHRKGRGMAEDRERGQFPFAAPRRPAVSKPGRRPRERDADSETASATADPAQTRPPPGPRPGVAETALSATEGGHRPVVDPEVNYGKTAG